MDASEIEIRALATRAELEACVALEREIWGDTFDDLVPASILKVSQRMGGVAAGAFDEGGVLLGFVFGLTGIEKGRVVHWSDMLAVREEARNMGVGRRLKLHQRDAVRACGAEIIYWTFDPLIARNAHLNFNRFGVAVNEYVEDMYGATGSVLHGALPTDRLVVAWPTDSTAAAARVAESRRLLESSDCTTAPIASEQWMASVAGAAIMPHCFRIAIPSAAEPILAGAPDEALRWRLEVRQAMKWGLGAGYGVGAFQLEPADERGYYVMTRASRSATGAGGSAR